MVWKILTKEHLDETKQHFASSGYVMQWYAMAMEIILTTLGPEWRKKNCLKESVAPDEFLSIQNESEDGRYNHQDRVIKLGHMLYALKDNKGFDIFITSLKTRDLLAVFFELSVANILNQNEFVVEFVEAKGQKGEDYDLMASKSGVIFFVEAKSRRTGITLDERTLHNALNKARKQLPITGPGMIFVSIPKEWTQNKDAEKVIGACIDSFFRNTSRVNYIILIWHQWIQLEVGKASVSLVRQYKNPSPRTMADLGQIIKPLTQLSLDADAGQQGFKPSFW